MKKLVLVFGLVMALSLVSVASAATLAELQAQLAVLTAQIAAMGGSATPAASSIPTITKSLNLGSTGDEVTDLQKYLEDEGLLEMPAGVDYGYFGPLTKKAVAEWQKANDVSPALGYFGPISRAALNALREATPVVPPVGTVPAGTLAGTDGNIASVTNLSQYSLEEVGAGSKDIKVLGMEVEASSDGDILLKSMKLNFDPTGNTGSKRLNRYISSVNIWNGSTKIGTASVDDFSKDSSDVYTKTVTLDNGVIIKAKEKAKIYVTVNAASVLDTGDIAGDSWTVDVDNIRFADGSGVVTTDTQSNGQNVTIDFVSYSSASDTTLKISLDSNTPDNGTVTVSTTADTNNVVLLKGKLKLEGTSDVLLDSFPVTFTSVGTGVATATTNVTLKLGDNTYSETVPVATGLSGTVTFDALDFTIEKGATVPFTILADINEIDGTYFTQGDTLTVSVSASNREVMDAENDQGDQLATSEKSGTATGNAQAFYSEGISVVINGTPTAVVKTGTLAGTSDQVDSTISFTVTAIDTDIWIDGDVVQGATVPTTDTDGLAWATTTQSNTGTSTVTGILAPADGTKSGDVTTTGSLAYKVADGTSRTFNFTVSSPTGIPNGAIGHRITGIKWDTDSGDSTASLYDFNLGEFATPTRTGLQQH